MYRSPSKKRQLVRRFAVYASMTIGVLFVVTFLVFIMLGYRFNRDTSSIQQGGLVQFASRPIDANVTLGKAKLSDQTPSKITTNPGSYDVTMTKNGYKPWKKSVDVRAGEVLWLNYTQLVPESIETKRLAKYGVLSDVKSAPNGDRFAVIGEATKPAVTFIDVTGETPKSTTITIPVGAYRADATPTFTLDDWANDSNRLLVNATYPDGRVERLLVDRRQAKDTINITAKYEADIVEAIFDPRSSQKLLIRSSTGDVRSIDTAGDTLSSVIAPSVSYMSIYGNDAILLVQRTSETEQSVGYVSLGSDNVRTLRRIVSNERVLIAAAQYFSEPHVAISTGAQLEVFKIPTLPSSESDAPISLTSLSSATLAGPVDYLSVRSGGRFVFAQYAGGVTTYDIELSKRTQTAIMAPMADEVRWLDKYHFYITNGSNLEVMEFDGGNPHVITGLTTKFDAIQSDNGTFIYSLNAVDGGYVMQQSRMILRN